jgi:hypothetical protein
MAKTTKDLWAAAAELEKDGADVANFKETVTKLPYTLKESFREKQDPKLDEAINKAQSDTFGAAISGLNKYKEISDPFARRDLAEQYQGIVSQGYQNLTDERTRRQGVYSDYIDKWTGLFGAEAARKQDAFNNKMQTWNMEKNLADTEENNRRWEIENARAERNSGNANKKSTFLADAIAELNASKGEDGKVNPNIYSEIRDLAATQGISKDEFDSQFSNKLGDWEYNNVGIKTEKPDELKAEQLRKIKMENDIVEQATKKTETEGYWSKAKRINSQGGSTFSKIYKYLYGG